MRNVDSPSIITGGLLRRVLTSRQHERKRLFRGHPTYKEMEPYIEDCCPYREDVLDFMVTLPPRNE